MCFPVLHQQSSLWRLPSHASFFPQFDWFLNLFHLHASSLSKICTQNHTILHIYLISYSPWENLSLPLPGSHTSLHALHNLGAQGLGLGFWVILPSSNCTLRSSRSQPPNLDTKTTQCVVSPVLGPRLNCALCSSSQQDFQLTVGTMQRTVPRGIQWPLPSRIV